MCVAIAAGTAWADVTVERQEGGQTLTEYYRNGRMAVYQGGRLQSLYSASSGHLIRIHQAAAIYCDATPAEMTTAAEKEYQAQLYDMKKDDQAWAAQKARKKQLDAMKISVRPEGGDTGGDYPAQKFLIVNRDHPVEEMSVSAALDARVSRDFKPVTDLRQRLCRLRVVEERLQGDPVFGAEMELAGKGYPVSVRSIDPREDGSMRNDHLVRVGDDSLSETLFTLPPGYKKVPYKEWMAQDEGD